MELPPQPPPDAPAPLPGPEARRSRRIALWIFIPGGLLVGAFLAMVLFNFLVAKPNANLSIVTANLRNLYLGLVVFETDYGSFPNASTAAGVMTATSTTASLGNTTSNELLRQLVATHVRSESLFYAPSSVCPRKPDNVLGPDTLAKGECAFAYVADLSMSGDPQTPVLMGPVLPAAKCFERRRDLRHRAGILFRDGSVRAFPVNSRGEVILNGMSLLDPRQPFWGGKPPDIKWPE